LKSSLTTLDILQRPFVEMHIHFLDPYQQISSPVHDLDGRAKFVLAVTFILITSLTPVAAWPVYILLYALVLSIEILSGLRIADVLKRSLLVAPFILAAFPVIFTYGEKSLLSFSISHWELIAHQEGLARFSSVAIKSWLSVQAAIVLVSTTSFPELLQAMRAVGIPRLLVAMFALMWRYLFVLADEAMRLMRARASRSGHSTETRQRTGGSIAWRARISGGMAGNLFLRAFDRSERIYTAMLSRGYDGEVRLLPTAPMNWVTWGLMLTGLALLGLLLCLGVLFWG
jgi:cobalt/nickel transport system permease protein